MHLPGRLLSIETEKVKEERSGEAKDAKTAFGFTATTRVLWGWAQVPT